MAVIKRKREVIIRKKKEPTPGFNIRTLLSRTKSDGDIGIEIEVEGNKFPKEGYYDNLIPSQWRYTHDGSLRGNDNAEYVFKKPMKFEEVPKAINDLWTMFKEFGSVLDESNRTSVHVHLNAQTFHLNRLCSFMALYYSVEEILTEWCGEHRVGNLFCLRAKDAPASVQAIKQFLQEDGQGAYLQDNLHYAGLNAQALRKYGSIEVRSLRGVTDPSTILDWVAVLERIYKLSGEFTDPRKICDNFSGAGPLSYLEMVLGDKTQTVKSGVSFDNQQIMQSLYEGIRLAQDLCYCRDWSLYKPVDLEPDPFRRPAKKIAQSLSAYTVDDIINSYAAMENSAVAPAPTGSATPGTPSEWFQQVYSSPTNSPVFPMGEEYEEIPE